MMDEETGEEGPAILKAKICDPYVMLLRIDGSVVVYKLDEGLELVEVEGGDLKVGISDQGRRDMLMVFV